MTIPRTNGQLISRARSAVAPKGKSLRKFIARYRRSAFLRNVAVLATGTALAQAFTVAATPILSRLYDPAMFGILAVIMSIMTPLAFVACWKYEVAIVLPKDDRSAANLFILSCILALFTCALTAVGLIIAGDWIAASLGNSAIIPLLWVIPLGILLTGLNSVATYWNTRRTAYTRQAASEISRAAGTTCFQILAGLAGAGANGLVFGRLAGSLLATLVLSSKIWRQDGKLIWHSLDWSSFKQLAGEHHHFPKYNMPKSFLNELSNMT